ncbi:aminodeoxychorismate synthase component I [candidate division KSB1 bacterium]|nr:MAG: aminodeoxychorismate synthase component I [candidate division KSB1 bacterium]MBC6947233.1 aminodeoxychorismate synthase component I [candidate division KSB1 bacterium]MCE7940311.1 aminodeoxychorismate synthase component I [Chlorobi bacterium CHB1]
MMPTLLKPTDILDAMAKNGVFPPAFIHWLANQPNALFLETTRCDDDNFRSYLFLDSAAVIQCHNLNQVEACHAEIDHALKQGYYAAGFLAYEAGYAFEQRLHFPVATTFPLLWFGIYESPIIYNHRLQAFENGGRKIAHILKQIPVQQSRVSPREIPDVFFNLSEKEYHDAITRIKEYIAAGDTYQVNFTFKLKFDWPHSPAHLYCRLRGNQRVSYAALLSLADHAILSLSPELFFRVDENRITLKPMKGTTKRGRTLDEDEHQQKWLKNSAKNRAENLMIVDLLRNDVGRVAQTSSVTVPRFFEIERYETVQQATSTITAELKHEITVLELMRCLFPSGSITGAPKIRTMQIIHELEKEPRGIYTGSLGFFSPQRRAVFNVAIRTVKLDKRTGAGEMGIGSGVVWDSDSNAEYHECLLKARFLTENAGEFQLIETMRWERGEGWFLLHEHLQRLENSAKYFDFHFDREAILRHLGEYAARLNEEPASYRVRLTLDREGGISIAHAPMATLSEPVRVRLANLRTHSQDRFLFHKTTRRDLYDRELKTAEAEGFFDVIFCNERGEITEGCRSNLIIKSEGRYFTPPLDCGVLPGVYRAHLVASGKFTLEEKILLPQELERAEEILLCNAVRGLVKAVLEKN